MTDMGNEKHKSTLAVVKCFTRLKLTEIRYFNPTLINVTISRQRIFRKFFNPSDEVTEITFAHMIFPYTLLCL